MAAVIDLPILAPDAGIEDAIAAMRKHDRRAAIVTWAPDDHRMYSNRTIRDAWSQGVKTMAKLRRSGERVAALAGPASGFEQLLDRTFTRYGIADDAAKLAALGGPPQRPGLIRIVTRHERYADDVTQAPKVCRCDSRQRHGADSPPAADGSACFCGGTFECF
jgi:hypothetical protein